MKEQDNKYTMIMELNKGDGFVFQGDRLNETYYYVNTDGPYSKVVQQEKDIETESKWAFVSCGSVVKRV